MTDQDLEKKLYKAFGAATPNVLDAVLSRCDEQKGTVITMKNKKNNRNSWVRIGAIAASLVLVLGLGLGFGIYNIANKVTSVVALDVNPSLEIRLNKNEKVVDVEALNADGEKIIDDMDLEGSDLDVAVNALLGSMLKNGYLNDITNSILVSVENDDPKKCAELQAAVSARVNDVLNTDAFKGAVLSQTVNKNNTLEELADEYDISIGKAQLIQTIINQNNRYEFADLALLSINQLNLLTVSGGHTLEGVDATGTASDKAYVGAEKAKEVALTHAGVNEADLLDVDIEMDMENGILVYEVDFDTARWEYEYDVHATRGQVLKHQKEANDYKIENNPAAPENLIGKDAAKEAALKHAGVAADAIREYECELDRHDGKLIYEVSFDTAEYEYEYDIDATTGAVIAWEKDWDDDKKDDTVIAPSAELIGKDAAKAAALKHAGVAADAIREYECELDRDDGRVVYEVSFDVGNNEYEYEIDAKTGAVITWHKELDNDIDDDYDDDDDDDDEVVTPPSNGVTAEEAKTIALNHAGVAAADIRDYECELDKENGAISYEISFKAGNMEYDYDIDAASGKILKSEKEIDD